MTSACRRARSGPSPTTSIRNPGTRRVAVRRWCSSRSIRLCGTRRATTVTVGSGSRGPVRFGTATEPFGTRWIGHRKCSRCRSSCRVEGETAATARGPYTRRVAVPSRNRPTAAIGRGSAGRTGPGARGAPPARSARPPRRRAGRRRGCRSGSRRPRRRRSGCAPCARPRGGRARAPHPTGARGCRRSPPSVPDRGTRGEPGDVRAGRDPPPGDLVHVLLRAAGLRMSDVAPVEHQHAAAAGRAVGSTAGEYRSPCRTGARRRHVRSSQQPAGRRARDANVERGSSVQATGISTIEARRRAIRRSSSTSKAKPVGLAGAAPMADRVAVEELEAALGVVDARDDRRVCRGTRRPRRRRRTAGGAAARNPGRSGRRRPREAPSTRSIAVASVSTGVARSASKKPTYRDSMVKAAGDRGALAGPGAPDDARRGAALGSKRPGISAVPSELPLSTTRIRDSQGCADR